MAELNPTIHQPARLRIMAALNALGPEGHMEFSALSKTLGFTDGNLGSHLQTLEAARYIRIEKVFVDRKPRSLISATLKGRNQFAEYVEALQTILAQGTKP